MRLFPRRWALCTHIIIKYQDYLIRVVSASVTQEQRILHPSCSRGWWTLIAFPSSLLHHCKFITLTNRFLRPTWVLAQSNRNARANRPQSAPGFCAGREREQVWGVSWWIRWNLNGENQTKKVHEASLHRSMTRDAVERRGAHRLHK